MLKRRFYLIPFSEDWSETSRSRQRRRGRSDLVPLWAGQSANLSTCTDVSAFLTSLCREGF